MALVLLAEDDPDLSLLMVSALGAFGHETVLCHDGAQALAAHAERRPDLVVLDLHLPGDLDGLDVVRRLRAEGVTTPVLMVTARSRPEDVAAGLAAGADAYLAKPFDITELDDQVRALVDRAG